MRADFHPEEEARLDLLRRYGVLDTPTEKAFDDVVALASAICGVSMALVSLLDRDRQWFKAEVGLGASETPRDVSVCAHAILQKDLFEVPDATADNRFADNPLVTGEPHMRFYAGVPLITPEGLPLGTLCVLDTQPHVLSDFQRDALKVLAKQVMTELELRRKAHELEEANAKLEARVEERTHQLERALQEAEAFNYSISHDLRAPLRSIASTSQILVEDLGEQLSEEYRQLLERQRYNAKRLGTLIDALLNLSRIGRLPLHRQPVDVTALVKEIAAGVGGLDGPEFEVQPEMAVSADPHLVRMIFTNLLENARKFTPQGGRICVGQAGAVFTVEDEGIGFDMIYAPKVFLPFERLVSEAEYPGTGIGLANVERLVVRHEGRIWVESEPGRGTTFYFTLAEDEPSR